MHCIAADDNYCPRLKKIECCFIPVEAMQQAHAIKSSTMVPIFSSCFHFHSQNPRNGVFMALLAGPVKVWETFDIWGKRLLHFKEWVSTAPEKTCKFTRTLGCISPTQNCLWPAPHPAMWSNGSKMFPPISGNHGQQQHNIAFHCLLLLPLFTSLGFLSWLFAFQTLCRHCCFPFSENSPLRFIGRRAGEPRSPSNNNFLVKDPPSRNSFFFFTRLCIHHSAPVVSSALLFLLLQWFCYWIYNGNHRQSRYAVVSSPWDFHHRVTNGNMDILLLSWRLLLLLLFLFCQQGRDDADDPSTPLPFLWTWQTTPLPLRWKSNPKLLCKMMVQ